MAKADSFSVDPTDQSNVIGESGGNTINYQRAGFPKPAPSVAAVATRTAAALGPFARLYPAWAAGATGPTGASAPAAAPAAPAATIAGQPVVQPGGPGAAAPGAGPLALLGQLPSDPGFDATLAQPGVARSPLDVLRGTAAASPVAPVPSAAENTGAAVRNAVGTAIDATGRAELGAWDATSGVIKAGARAVARPIAAGMSAVGGFARGLLGRSVPAGVSNASAAQFGQPTADNPLPTTATSPVGDIDKSANAIARFGKNKRQFSGF